MSVSSDFCIDMNPPYPLHPSVADLLAPQYVEYYNRYLLNAKPVHHQPLSISRLNDRVIPGASPCLTAARFQDFDIPRQQSQGNHIKVRAFTPTGIAPPTGWPIVLYFHGGGWVFGDITTENNICSHMCVSGKAVVIATDYRLAPEYPYPAAVEDCWETILWSIETGAGILNADIHKAAIGGASAGANLAAALTQIVSRTPTISKLISFKLQCLVVPVLDNTATVDNNPTWRALEHTAGLPAAKMLWYRDHYLPEFRSRYDSNASPLLYEGDLGCLPPAVILVGGCDILRHEGEEYGRRLQHAGVTVTVEVMEGMPHPFLAMDEVLDEGKRAFTILCATLAEAFQ